MYEPQSHAVRIAGLAFAVPVVLALGCASPGPPRAPSLRLPARVEKLQAHRAGDMVELTWQTPANTTDGDKIRGTVTAVVCREGVRGSSVCDPVRRMPVSAGASEVVETLPGDLRTGPARLLGYRVELLNDRGRSAGRSEAAFAAAGEVPPTVGPLTVSPRREAALIRWEPVKLAAAMELRRKLVATSDGPVIATSAAAKGQRVAPPLPAGAKKTPGVPLAGGARPPAAEVTLIIDAALADAGGVLDRNVRDGDSYEYVAQRVRTVTLEGHVLELRGVPSAATAFVYHDTFPPHEPVGLVSVPGGGFGAALSIDLSWEPNAETDVLGYNVYRRQGSGAFVRLNAEPLTMAAYRDMKVEAGQAYAYRVTAVDARQHESAPSGEIRESLRK